MSKDDYLFVYGTLRRDAGNPTHHVLSQHTDFVSQGTYQGRLYDLGKYPGAVPSDQSSDAVTGEVYVLNDRDPLLKRLDEYEGPRFRRQRVTISLANGEEVVAWIYLYDGATNELETIPSGDYLEFRKP